jgi:hypothetical protein
MKTWGAALAALVLVLAPACADDRAYQDDNRALLASIPVYPGAREVSREDSVRTEGEHDAGWTLGATYSLPPGVTVEHVLGFYRDNLPGWTPEPGCCDGLDVASFLRGDEAVNVNADNVEQAHTYDLGVDAHRTRDDGR